LGRAPVAAIAFFVAALSPLLGFIPLYTFRFTFVADHYQYLASMGLIALFTAVALRQTVTWQLARNTRWALSFTVLFVLGALTWQRGYAYADEETLWRDTLRRNPTSFIANGNLGGILLLRGELEPAADLLQAALRAKPDFPEALDNLGTVRDRQGRRDEAVALFREALRSNPYFANAHNNLGVALAQQGKPSEAMDHFRDAIRIRPSFAKAHLNLGLTLERLGRTEDSVVAYYESLRWEPNAPDVARRLAWILATDPDPRVRNGVEAVRFAEAALSAVGFRNPRTMDVLAAAYAEAGRFPDAVRMEEQASAAAIVSSGGERDPRIEQRLALYRAGLPFRRTRE
jgi:tetratricopeptide (TPR) repeat protein